MQRVVLSLCVLTCPSAVATVAAQGFYPGFALVVQLPSYETFLTNLGDSPIRVDAYLITSASGSLNQSGWNRMETSGPEILDALGRGADQFFAVSASAFEFAEINPAGSATWQPGQSWSIGFPFSSDTLGFDLDADLLISSPDGLLLTGGTVVTSPDLAPAALLVVPEPSSGVLCLLAIAGISALCLKCRWDGVRR